VLTRERERVEGGGLRGRGGRGTSKGNQAEGPNMSGNEGTKDEDNRGFNEKKETGTPNVC